MEAIPHRNGWITATRPCRASRNRRNPATPFRIAVPSHRKRRTNDRHAPDDDAFRNVRDHARATRRGAIHRPPTRRHHRPTDRSKTKVQSAMGAGNFFSKRGLDGRPLLYLSGRPEVQSPKHKRCGARAVGTFRDPSDAPRPGRNRGLRKARLLRRDPSPSHRPSALLAPRGAAAAPAAAIDRCCCDGSVLFKAGRSFAL